MGKVFFVTGSGTGVGKTFAASVLLKMFRDDGFSVCPLKPVESGVCHGEESDIDRLLKYSGADLSVEEVSPYRFTLPASPHLAAKDENKKIITSDLKMIVDRYKDNFDYTLVEGCGGLMVPLTEDGYLVSDWIKSLGVPVVLVTSLELGTINHTLLSVELCRAKGIPLMGIIFSNVEEAKNQKIYSDNIKTITRLSGVPILGNISYTENISDINPGDFINRELFYSLI